MASEIIPKYDRLMTMEKKNNQLKMYLWKKQPMIFQLVMLVFIIYTAYIVPKVLDHPCPHVSHE